LVACLLLLRALSPKRVTFPKEGEDDTSSCAQVMQPVITARHRGPLRRLLHGIKRHVLRPRAGPPDDQRSVDPDLGFRLGRRGRSIVSGSDCASEGGRSSSRRYGGSFPFARLLSGVNPSSRLQNQSPTPRHHRTSSTLSSASTAVFAPAPRDEYNGHLAVDCLPYDQTPPEMAEVKQIVTDEHLLQFGMLIGEASAELAIGMRAGAAQPVGPASSASLYGPVDCPSQWAAGWEPIIEEHQAGLHYWVVRRKLRKV
jgi:hypothetical protein